MRFGFSLGWFNGWLSGSSVGAGLAVDMTRTVVMGAGKNRVVLSRGLARGVRMRRLPKEGSSVGRFSMFVARAIAAAGLTAGASGGAADSSSLGSAGSSDT